MSTRGQEEAVDRLTAALDTLTGHDVAALDDHALRGQLLNLTICANRLQAELARRVDIFDRRGLAEPDGFRTAKSWLQGFGRLSAQAAGRLVTAARLLRQLPKLAAATQAGDASPEHVQQVARLAARVGAEPVAEVEATLAEAAQALDPGRFQQVCDRAAAHLDPDGPDPARTMEQRSLSLAPSGGMLHLRGLLDPEGGAALSTALDALMTPPVEGDERTPGQRRADALAELARRQLAAGTLPTVGGQRPQISVLLHPQALSPATLTRLAEQHRTGAAGRRLRELATASDPQPVRDWTRPGIDLDPAEQIPTSFGHTSHTLRQELHPATPGSAATKPTAEQPRPTNPPELPGTDGPTVPSSGHTSRSPDSPEQPSGAGPLPPRPRNPAPDQPGASWANPGGPTRPG